MAIGKTSKICKKVLKTIGFYNNQQFDSIFNMLSDRSKVFLSLEKTKETFSKLTTQLGELKSYEFKKEEQDHSIYKTTFSNAILSLVVSINKENKLESFHFLPYKADTTTVSREKSNFVLKTPNGNIYGTLTMPVSKKKIPVVLIIAGSGPTDRNGNSDQGGLKSNAYKLILDN